MKIQTSSLPITSAVHAKSERLMLMISVGSTVTSFGRYGLPVPARCVNDAMNFEPPPVL
jgi:hypothetical protein